MVSKQFDEDLAENFAEKVNEFEKGFQYPEDIQNNPQFWVDHVRQQIQEAENSYEAGDLEHMVVEFGDAILVCWRAMQVFGEDPPEEILNSRIEQNLSEKGYDSIMKKYTEWWRSGGREG